MKRDLVDRYRGCRVAIDEAGDVLAAADGLGELRYACQGKGFSSDVTVHRVPEADTPLVIGLG
jgi:hypothetical protein